MSLPACPPPAEQLFSLRDPGLASAGAQQVCPGLLNQRWVGSVWHGLGTPPTAHPARHKPSLGGWISPRPGANPLAGWGEPGQKEGGLHSWGWGTGQGLAGPGCLRWGVCPRPGVCVHTPVCAPVCANPPAPPPHAWLGLPGELFLQKMKMTVRVTHARSPHTVPLLRGPLIRSPSAFTPCPGRASTVPPLLAAAPGTPSSRAPGLCLWF